MLTSAMRGEKLTPNPNECNSTLTSATRVETLTPNPNECYSTLTSETRDINLTRRNRYRVQKSYRSTSMDYRHYAKDVKINGGSAHQVHTCT